MADDENQQGLEMVQPIMQIKQEKQTRLVQTEQQIQYQNVSYITNKYWSRLKKKVTNWEDMPARKIVMNVSDPEVGDNKIETAKYNLLTFVPHNLYEQFSKFANVYFLFLGSLSMIPEISTSGGSPVLFIPLTFIILVTAFKDFYEDLSRKNSDKKENMGGCWRVGQQGIQQAYWGQLQIGDVIQVRNNEFFPADVLLLSSSDAKGVAYIETKNLDGETNMKQKKVAEECQQKYQSYSAEEMWECRDMLEYEHPNPFIYLFQGNLKVGGLTVPVDQNQVALRGCSLRNTESVYGLVIYNGETTKIMLNSVKARAKVSNVMRQMNKYILGVVGLQMMFCMVAAICNVIITDYKTKENSIGYLYIDNTQNKFTQFWIRFGNWLLLFGNFVPISLLVTLEMVKYFQGKIIQTDYHFFSNKFNIPTMVQTSSLNEELGQIQYIFSDKTGTLTQNIMEFKLVDVHGKVYGQEQQAKSGEIILEEQLEDNKYEYKNYPRVDKVDFNDPTFMHLLEKGDQSDPEYKRVREYLFQLGLCHTIICTQVEGRTVYNASSPDEYALVQMALYCGFQYQGIDEDNNMLLLDQRQNTVYSYKLLDVLEFNSARKRMSVILRDNQTQEIILYCKGADNIVHARLSEESKQAFEATNDNLENFAKVGLRTLLLAKKVLGEEEYSQWKNNYNLAMQDLTDKEAKMEEQQELIEKELYMVGATAIEDKLQEDVGNTILYIKRAGIKVWVLTGDKLETAINIGYSCQLLDDGLLKLIIEEKDTEQIRQKLKELQQQVDELVEEDNNNIQYALIISGESLMFIQDEEMKASLAGLADKCEVVVACRVSPKQKAEIVNLVKQYKPSSITLAIGDGANDVNMITAAHVGVGIMGVEGNQAARASDYSMGEFKFLRRLLLVKGREFYRRNSMLICYNFWKNFILVVPSFLYGFFNIFSGQQLYDSFLIELYNVFFCTLPIIYYALHDKEYPEKELISHPHYYNEGRLGKYFSRNTFFYWAFNGILYSNVILYGLLMSIAHPYDENGVTQYLQYTGYQLLFLVIFVANMKVVLFSYSITLTQQLINHLSTLSYVLLSFIIAYFPFADSYYEYKNKYFPFIFFTAMVMLTAYSMIVDLSIEKYLSFSRKEQLSKEKNIEKEQHQEAEKTKVNNVKRMSKVFSNKMEEVMLSNKLQKFIKNMIIGKNKNDSNIKRYTGFAFSKEEKRQ